MIDSEINVLESDYRHLRKDEYRNSPWFALRVLFPLKRKASWEIVDKNHFALTKESNNDIGDSVQENNILNFVASLKSLRPHISKKQLTTIFVLINTLPDIYTPSVLETLYDNTFKLNLWKSKNLHTHLSTAIVRPFMKFEKVSAEHLNSILSRTAERILSGDVKFSGYANAYDKVSKAVDLIFFPGFKYIANIEYSIDRYLSESDTNRNSRAANTTIGTLSIGGRVFGSFLQGFGNVFGGEAAHKSFNSLNKKIQKDNK